MKKSNGIAVWSDLPPIAGEALLIVNSHDQAREEVERALRAMVGLTGDRGPMVIAGRQWAHLLSEHSIGGDRVLFSEVSGAPLELNHFLESVPAIDWFVQRPFAVIAGSAPGSLYNEEVKDAFEQRLLLLAGDATFLIHTLPLPYVYRLDAPALVRRLGRSRQVALYQQRTRALLGDLKAQWHAEATGGVADETSMATAMGAITRHIGRSVIDFDEQSPIPITVDRADGIDAGAARLLAHLRDVIHDRDLRLTRFSVEMQPFLDRAHQTAWQRLLSRARRLLGMEG